MTLVVKKNTFDDKIFTRIIVVVVRRAWTGAVHLKYQLSKNLIVASLLDGLFTTTFQREMEKGDWHTGTIV